MYIPQWFPGAGWKRIGKVWKGRVHRMIETPFERARSEEAREIISHNLSS